MDYQTMNTTPMCEQETITAVVAQTRTAQMDTLMLLSEILNTLTGEPCEPKRPMDGENLADRCKMNREIALCSMDMAKRIKALIGG